MEGAVGRRKLTLLFWISALSITYAGTSRAQTMLPQEPGSGMLRPSEKALVDDHSCPQGQVKEVTGGSNRRYVKDIEIPGTPRQRRCIIHP
jgi:hypothetical protein